MVWPMKKIGLAVLVAFALFGFVIAVGLGILCHVERPDLSCDEREGIRILERCYPQFEFDVVYAVQGASGSVGESRDPASEVVLEVPLGDVVEDCLAEGQRLITSGLRDDGGSRVVVEMATGEVCSLELFPISQGRPGADFDVACTPEVGIPLE